MSNEAVFGDVTVQFPSRWSDTDGGELMWKQRNGPYRYLVSMMEYEVEDFMEFLEAICGAEE